MDYLRCRRTNNGVTFISPSVDLAEYELFRVKFMISDKDGLSSEMKISIPCPVIVHQLNGIW